MNQNLLNLITLVMIFYLLKAGHIGGDMMMLIVSLLFTRAKILILNELKQ